MVWRYFSRILYTKKYINQKKDSSSNNEPLIELKITFPTQKIMCSIKKKLVVKLGSFKHSTNKSHHSQRRNSLCHKILETPPHDNIIFWLLLSFIHPSFFRVKIPYLYSIHQQNMGCFSFKELFSLSLPLTFFIYMYVHIYTYRKLWKLTYSFGKLESLTCSNEYPLRPCHKIQHISNYGRRTKKKKIIISNFGEGFWIY